MTVNMQNRQPAGRPVGGEYAPTVHAEPGVALSPAAPAGPSSVELLVERDAIRARMDRVWEADAALALPHQIASLKAAAAALREQHPTAKHLVLRSNLDGENQADPWQLLAADGTVLEDADDDDSWVYETVGDDNGPEVGELLLTLPDRYPYWADGIADVSSARSETQYRVDLDKAIAAPTPAGDRDPRTRILTTEEQSALVDAAQLAIDDLDDRINERYMDYEPADLERMREQRDRLEQIIKGA